ncbi:MAG: hypothetical protein ACLGHN_08880 [Bacteriovoracia bacterium]
MKHILLYAALFSLVACSTGRHNSRTISSTKDLTGTYLGVADYGRGHNGPNKPATRIYFHPIEGQSGKYDVVLLEYVNLLKMAPSYIASNKLPIIAKRTGFLKNINTKIYAYEATPGAEGTFELRPLVVLDDKIEVKQDAKPRILTLAPDADPKNPLEGATLSSGDEEGPKEIFFPKKGDKKKTGLQYKTAKLAYEKAKLESTWRKNFLKGPYLSQYYNKEDVVLKLRDNNLAEFVLNPKFAKTSAKKRKRMFTNSKSAFLEGNFTVTEPRDGMFLFHSTDADDKSKEIVEGKIALFIDIFDATKSLNQDVVELALIDSEKPEDFLMYYEHPENGEGTEPVTPAN